MQRVHTLVPKAGSLALAGKAAPLVLAWATSLLSNGCAPQRRNAARDGHEVQAADADAQVQQAPLGRSGDASRVDAGPEPASSSDEIRGDSDGALGAGPNEPDGDDDPLADAPGTGIEPGRFVRVGKPPLSLRRICDLTVLGDALYAAHSNEPLGTDGATVTRYRPTDTGNPFSIAFDWNRPGEPAKGGGAGQGFLRVHRIGGRLFVPDADPPYGGFGIADPATEGYVFVSAEDGSFAPPRAPRHRPPKAPTLDGGPGAAVLPRAYHVIDAIRYRGRMIASTGSVPPRAAAWRDSPSPGALHTASEDIARWLYEVDYPYPYRKDNVWRLTYLVRFHGRLYAGIQDYMGRERNDFIYVSPAPGAATIEHADVHPVRITSSGVARTLRWYVDKGNLYWIAIADRAVQLWVTEDGDHWTVVPLPQGIGAPTDIVRFRGELVVLTEWQLLRLGGDGPVALADITDKKSPFRLNDDFCAAPLAVFRGELYAGGQLDGALYKFAAQSP